MHQKHRAGMLGLPRRMEIRQLESFLALADTLHFGRAAERVYLSQPALSRQIQHLERELGTRLLERASGRVALTEAGCALQAHARRALDELQAARLAIAHAAGQPSGHLSIACFDSASAYLVPELLARLDAAYPGVSLSVATLGTREALRAVRQGEVESALVTLPVADGALEVRPLYREQLVAALPRHHPLARHRAVSLQALAAERLVTFLAGQNNTRRLIDRAFQEAGHAPAAVIEIESVQAIKDAVRAGLGVAILGEMVVSSRRVREVGLVARPLAPPHHREIGLVWRAGRSQHPLLEPLSGLIAGAARGLGLPTLRRAEGQDE